MARKKKKKLSEEETDELVNDWIASIDDLRNFFFEYSPEEIGDVFYDKFLEKFNIVVNVFNLMVEQRMIVKGDSVEDKELKEIEDTLNIKPKNIKGRRNDN